MFETVAPEIAGRRSRLILYESLPVSLAVHGAAIAGGHVRARVEDARLYGKLCTTV